MALEISDLRVFLAVVEAGSFTRAATSLMMAQPSVSERISGLERQTRTRLFERSARGTGLTSAGERLVPYARRCVLLLDDALEDLRSDASVPRLRIAVHLTFAHRAVPFALTALGDLDRRISVRDAHSPEVLAMLVDETADVGFVLPETPTRTLRYEPLPADPVVCVVAPDHPLANRTSVTLRDVAGSRVAVNAWGNGASTFLELLEHAGLPDTSLRPVSDAGLAAQLARDFGHVAACTASSVEHDVARGELVRLTVRGMPKWKVPFAFAYRRRDADDLAIQALVAAARAARSKS
jgi:DNA-binding transcriptional LysR family regulator